MPVYLKDDTTGHIRVSLNRIKRVARILLKLRGHQDSELSILFLDDPAMHQLNKTYRQKDKPTNVLAFPMLDADIVESQPLLGDVVISLETTAREAQEKNITIHHRVTELLIHGLLHLLGYDHERSPREAKIMESEEQKLSKLLSYEQRRNQMIKLAINIDHVATLRQARGINEPDPITAAGICELAGAAGIVVHLREDRRHIQDRDVLLLRQTVKTKLNLEMGATEEIIKIALALKPDMITLVPEKRKELTTEGGLNVAGQLTNLKKVVKRMSAANIPVSMFIDPNSEQIEASKEAGATFVEIHTGRYSDAANEEEEEKEFDLIATAAEEAFEAGLRVNAGHGLNYLNTSRVAALGTIEELSIGHAVMARAIFVGLDQAVREMLALIK
ncbi:MAG: pyridoxine 5'-phosphate synthase [Proteobacteria bacterium]|nr:pyridoxine 5'-phosphate synthase [Pseudomonadota bacterium]MBU1715233.1 pyridoxine 5'-phosphate synthase [Pseudomonadota bacterium]